MLAAQAGGDDDEVPTQRRTEVGRLLIARFPACVEIKDKQGMDAVRPAASCSVP